MHNYFSFPISSNFKIYINIWNTLYCYMAAILFIFTFKQTPTPPFLATVHQDY
jgi:hypothetical protein